MAGYQFCSHVPNSYAQPDLISAKRQRHSISAALHVSAASFLRSSKLSGKTPASVCEYVRYNIQTSELKGAGYMDCRFVLNTQMPPSCRSRLGVGPDELKVGMKTAKERASPPPVPWVAANMIGVLVPVYESEEPPWRKWRSSAG